jgi:hypothetical protein
MIHIQHSAMLVTSDNLSRSVTILYFHHIVSACGILCTCCRLWVALAVVGRVMQLSHQALLWLPQTLHPALLLSHLPTKHVFEPCTVVSEMVRHHQQRIVFLAKLYHPYIMVRNLRVREKVMNELFIKYLKSRIFMNIL